MYIILGTLIHMKKNFKIQKILENVVYKSISIKKSDTSINLILPSLYEDYLQNLRFNL